MDFMGQENEYILEAERRAKQNYLREEILDNGYPAEAFTEFIEVRKGANIDLWTFEELHECVKEFKNAMRQRQDDERKQAKRAKPPAKTTASSASPKVAESSPEVKLETPIVDMNTVPTFNSDTTDDLKEEPGFIDTSQLAIMKPKTTEWETSNHNSVYILPTLKAPETDLVKYGPLVSRVLEPEIITKTIFLQKTVIYNVHTEPAGWKVKRRYEDFMWLDDLLSNMYPTSYVINIQRPPLSGKSRKSKIEKDLADKRQVFLSNYLNALLRNPLFRRCSYLFSFLSETNEQAFKNTQKQSKREKKPSSIEEFYSVTGDVTCDPNDSRDLVARIQEYATKSEIIKYRLEKESENIYASLNSLSKSLNDFSELIGELRNIQAVLPWGESSQALLEQVQKSFKTWAITEEDLKETFKDHVHFLYSYTKKEIRPLNGIIKETENYYNFYVKNSYKLKETKEKLWKTRDIKKWDLEESGILKEILINDKDLAFSLMCSKESAKLKELRNFYAFFNSECLKETNRVLKDSHILDTLHLEKWCSKTSRQNRKLQEVWETLKYSVKSVIEGIIEEQPLIQIN